MTDEEMYVELLAHKRHNEELSDRVESARARSGGGTMADAAALERGLAALASGAPMSDVLKDATEAGKRAHREHPELVQQEEPDLAALEEQLASLLGPGM